MKLSTGQIYEYELKCHPAIAVCVFAFKSFKTFSDRTMSLKVEFQYSIVIIHIHLTSLTATILFIAVAKAPVLRLFGSPVIANDCSLLMG